MLKRLPVVSLLVILLAMLPACTPGRGIRDTNIRAPAPAAPVITIPAGLGPGDREGSLPSGGVNRTFLLHLPPRFDGKTPLPLVLVLHGGGGNAEGAARMTGFSREADREGFMVAYPNGSGRMGAERLLTWNSGNCCGYALDSSTDDVGFIRDLIDGLGARLPVDTARVYATGISNGGMMSYRLACELSGRLAAIAPVAGALNLVSCDPAVPVSVIIFHGTDDQHILYEGGKPLKQLDQTHPRIDQPVSYAVDFWVKADGCGPEPAREASGKIIRQSWTGGKNGSEVALYTIQGGGHAWPGGDPGWAGGDAPTSDISATPLIWDFFKRHPGPGAPPVTSSPYAGRPVESMTTLVERGAKTLDWSAGLNRLTVEKYGADTYVDIWSVNPDGSGLKCLTCSPPAPQRHNGNSAWSPDGDWIAFTAEQAGNPRLLWKEALPGAGFNNDLWVMKADGSAFYPLTSYARGTRAVIHPHFSPDGRQLFWAERLGGTPGSRWGEWALRLAEFKVENGHPVLGEIRSFQPGANHYFYESHNFSPDGRRALITANPDGQSDTGLDIYALDLQTGQAVNLTRSPGDWDEHGQYSPDGLRIAWMSATGFPSPEPKTDDFAYSFRGLRSELWLMDADGARRQQLTFFNTPGYPEYMAGQQVIVSDISWGPDGKTLAVLVAYGKDGPEQSKIVLIRLRDNLASPSASPAIPTLTPGNHSLSLGSAGKERRYLLHVPPSYDGRVPVPVVMMLHGGGGTADAARRETGWDVKADREGFLAVFPQGLPPFPDRPASFLANPPKWNDGANRGPVTLEADDAGYIRALLDDLAQKANVDPNRVYATGFSNGASMTFRLGVALNDRLAAIAPVSGHLFLKDVQLKYPLPMLFIIGTEDPLNPLGGGTVKTPWGKTELKTPALDSVTTWVDAVDAVEQPRVFLDDNGVLGALFGPGRQDAVVVYYTIEGAGHTWPGGLSLLPESMVGKRTDKLNATDVVWEFFKSHPRTG